VRQKRLAQLSIIALLASLSLAACTATTTSLRKVHHDDAYRGTGYDNFLVIGVTENYDIRAQFEREVVSEIRRAGANATAYYTLRGNNPPVSRDDIRAVVEKGDFDAIVITRVTDSAQDVSVKDGRATGDAVVKGDSFFDLFRYDYEEFDEPENVRVSTSVTLVTELYAVADLKSIWAVESSSHDRQSVQQIIDSEAQAIGKALVKDRLVGSK
jgi:hypothetical protein